MSIKGRAVKQRGIFVVLREVRYDKGYIMCNKSGQK